FGEPLTVTVLAAVAFFATHFLNQHLGASSVTTNCGVNRFAINIVITYQGLVTGNEHLEVIQNNFLFFRGIVRIDENITSFFDFVLFSINFNNGTHVSIPFLYAYKGEDLI